MVRERDLLLGQILKSYPESRPRLTYNMRVETLHAKSKILETYCVRRSYRQFLSFHASIDLVMSKS